MQRNQNAGSEMLQYILNTGIMDFSATAMFALRRADAHICRATADPVKIAVEEAAQESGTTGHAFAHFIAQKLPGMNNLAAIDMLCVAARHGNLPACEVLYRDHLQEACPVTALRRACKEAAAADHAPVIQWALNSYPENTRTILIYAIGTAARRGDLAMTQWITTLIGDFYHMNVIDSAAEGGHLHILRWVRSVCCPFDKSNRECYWDKAVYYACCCGNLDVLEWMLEARLPMDAAACGAAAAKNGHLRALKMLRRRCRLPLTNAICKAAAEAGHLHVIVWLLSENCPHQNIELHVTGTCDIALMQWAIESGFPLCDSMAYYSAAELGRMDTILWLHAQGFPVDPLIYGVAARNGHVEILQWAHQEGYQCHASICTRAAFGGHLHVLQWATAAGFPADADQVMQAASEKGHDECVYWAHRQGAALPDSLCVLAASKGRLELLQWAHAQGCALVCAQGNTCEAAENTGHLEVLKWAYEQGCPWHATANVARSMRYEEVHRWALSLLAADA